MFARVFPKDERNIWRNPVEWLAPETGELPFSSPARVLACLSSEVC